MSIAENLQQLQNELPKETTLVAVSKTKPETAILEAYHAGQRVFGENKIQEMVDKYESLPKDIQWHMIGHVQRNKVKYMAPFVSLIHAVDSLKLLKEINKRAQQNERTINCLLQLKIAKEDSKFGMSRDEIEAVFKAEAFQQLKNVCITGLMGMATFTENTQQIEQEFDFLKQTYDDLAPRFPDFKHLSMGMSGDYKIALKKGSTMVRIGSNIFGVRNY